MIAGNGVRMDIRACDVIGLPWYVTTRGCWCPPYLPITEQTLAQVKVAAAQHGLDPVTLPREVEVAAICFRSAVDHLLDKPDMYWALVRWLPVITTALLQISWASIKDAGQVPPPYGIG